MDNKYIGHQLQMYGVEEYRLEGGKGGGMRMYNVRNCTGLEFLVCPDRCADIPRLSFKGDNMGFFSACGYVAPQYYERQGMGFLKSFNAGFLTTCGLTAPGSPGVDDGEETVLHGVIGNTPCDNISHWIENDEIHIKAIVREAQIFSHQMLLEREYIVPLNENVIYLNDTIKNIGSMTSPVQILYHCNMGYPLLSENAVVNIPAVKTVPRDEHAAEGMDGWSRVEKPQRGYTEMCFFHTMEGKPEVSIYNKDIKKGLKICYDTKELKYFTEWKMMGEYDYALGLEPGNCEPNGRADMRERGILEFLEPGEERKQSIKFVFSEE